MIKISKSNDPVDFSETEINLFKNSLFIDVALTHKFLN